MDLFKNAKAVRLRSHHGKYLTVAEDEESVTQNRSGSSKNARWTVEFVAAVDGGSDTDIIRLKSCYNKYLTASNQPFLLGMTGLKVLQTLPRRKDSSVEWEPVGERGGQVKLKTRYGHFLRGNGGPPPWRNTVTHDVAHRTGTQDWFMWDVHVVEILVHSPMPRKSPPVLSVPQSDSIDSESTKSNSNSDSIDSESIKSNSNSNSSFSRQESTDSLSLQRKPADFRTMYYRIADENGDVDESVEELCTTFKGNGVEELTQILEEETGLKNLSVYSRSPLNGRLYPLFLRLPPNNVTMHIVLLQSHDQQK